MIDINEQKILLADQIKPPSGDGAPTPDPSESTWENWSGTFELLYSNGLMSQEAFIALRNAIVSAEGSGQVVGIRGVTVFTPEGLTLVLPYHVGYLPENPELSETRNFSADQSNAYRAAIELNPLIYPNYEALGLPVSMPVFAVDDNNVYSYSLADLYFHEDHGEVNYLLTSEFELMLTAYIQQSQNLCEFLSLQEVYGGNYLPTTFDHPNGRMYICEVGGISPTGVQGESVIYTDNPEELAPFINGLGGMAGKQLTVEENRIVLPEGAWISMPNPRQLVGFNLSNEELARLNAYIATNQSALEGGFTSSAEVTQTEPVHPIVTLSALGGSLIALVAAAVYIRNRLHKGYKGKNHSKPRKNGTTSKPAEATNGPRVDFNVDNIVIDGEPYALTDTLSLIMTTSDNQLRTAVSEAIVGTISEKPVEFAERAGITKEVVEGELSRLSVTLRTISDRKDRTQDKIKDLRTQLKSESRQALILQIEEMITEAQNKYERLKSDKAKVRAEEEITKVIEQVLTEKPVKVDKVTATTVLTFATKLQDRRNLQQTE